MTNWWEANDGDPPGFIDWLRVIAGYDAKSPGEVSADGRRWFRRFFETEGPAASEVVNRAWVARQIAVGGDAVSAVLRDLERTTSEQCRSVVEVDEWGSARLGFWYRDSSSGYTYGGFAGSPLWEIEPAAIFAEVADEIQEQLLGVVVDGSWKCWPACGQHHAGLHAEVHGDRAVWWCRVGEHAAAEIGSLGENESAR